MRKVVTIFVFAIVVIIVASCRKSISTSGSDLQSELSEYIESKDASIGIAVIIDRTDTIQINGYRYFPMLSVYKFPIAVALGEYLRRSNEFIPDKVAISQSELTSGTYSPMRQRFAGQETFQLTLDELLAYALQLSDNNASDILLNIMGGAEKVMKMLKKIGVEDVKVASTENEIYADNQLCYENTATPIALARLLDSFDREFDDEYSRNVKQLMETCATGEDRLAKPLSATGAIIGHKTGTGFTLPDGRLMAINDIGYVHLPNGTSYSIAVLIENSGYDMAQTEEIIAKISEIVLTHLM